MNEGLSADAYEELIEHTLDMVTVLDETGTILYENDAVERILGYEKHERIGSDGLENIHPQDRERVVAEFYSVVEASQGVATGNVEYRLQHTDGSWVWVESRGSNQTTTAIDGYVVTTRDISERKTHAQAISDLRDRLELAVEAANLGVWDRNMVTGEVEYNEEWAEMLGYSLDEIDSTVTAWKERVHPDDREMVETALEDHTKEETPYYETEHRLLTADGEWKWIRDVGKVVERDADGKPLRAVGIHLDIDERKNRERALETMRDRMEYALEVTDSLIVGVDLNSDDIRTIYGPVEDIFGVSAEGFEDVALFFERGVHPDDIETVRAEYEGVKRGETDNFDIEFRTHPASGPVRWVGTTGKVQTEKDTREIIGLVTDITQQKRREEAVTALHESARRFGNADSEDEVYEVLIEAAEEILDFSLVAVDIHEGDALVQRAWSLDQDSEGYYTRTPLDEDTLATRAFKQGETILAEDLRDYEITPADPEYRSALTVPIGEVGTFQTVSREADAFDQSDRKLAELLVGHANEALQRLGHAKSLRRNRERLERENERLETITSILSHDLRNPLNVADGNIELLRGEADSERLETAAEALDRMSDLIEDVLTWAQKGAQVTRDETSELDLGEVAEQCWRNVEMGQATLDIEQCPTIVADQSRIQHVFENLFRNAVEHGGESVRIRVGALEDGFYIEDDGPGIPADKRERVFEYGYTTGAEGSGLGLNIVQQIVAAQGWEISVTEGADGGARFEISGVELVDG